MVLLVRRTLAITPHALLILFVLINIWQKDWKHELCRGLRDFLQSEHRQGSFSQEHTLQEHIGTNLKRFSFTLGALIVWTTSSSGISFLNFLVTGHSSLGNLRKSGPFCQGVFLSTSGAEQDDLVGKSAGFKGPAMCCRGSKSVSGNFSFHSCNLPMTTARLLAR